MSGITLEPGELRSFYTAVSEATGTEHALVLRAIESGPATVHEVADVLAEGETSRLVVVQDDVEILRDGEPVKALVADRLRATGRPVEILVVDDPRGLHTTSAHIDEVRAALRPGDAVLALGSGTITDITKHAVHGFEAEHERSLRLVVLQTANSVCAFTSGLAVVTTDGVKRTVPSRLPDALLLDTTLLAQAPREYTHGGIGDASVAAASIADYRLASLLGMGTFEPAALAAVDDIRSAFLHGDPLLADPGPKGAERLALQLAACGLAMTFAGESAPLSGLEHVTSHMLDMGAEHFGREIGNHGQQCALATVLSLLAFRHLVEEVDIAGTEPAFPDDDEAYPAVAAAFDLIDPSGAATLECWSDYRTKLAGWREARAAVDAFRRDWPRHREVLRGDLADPRAFVEALAATGHPLRFENVPPGIGVEEARWAFANARLMRKRLSVADVLAFFGGWDDDLVDGIFAEFAALGAASH